MPRLPKEIFDSINGRKINNPPEWYDYIDKKYICTSRDAFSGILFINKKFPGIVMIDDSDKILKWARENKLLSESVKKFTGNKIKRIYNYDINGKPCSIKEDIPAGKITIEYSVGNSKINLVELEKNIMALVKYLSIPQDDRKELFRMFRISTINKTLTTLYEHREKLREVDINWNQPSLILTLNVEKIKADQAAIREILENKIAYYEKNLEQFKKNTKRYGYNFELPKLLKPVIKQITDIGRSKYKATELICDLLIEFGIQTDKFILNHYIK